MSRPRPSGGPLPWPTYQNGQYVPVSGRASRSEGQLNIAAFGGDGQVLGNLYRHGPYFGCEFQVEWGPIERGLATGMRLNIHSFVAVCRVLRTAPKRGKKCLWGWPEDENVLRCHIAKRGLLWVSAPQAWAKYGSACPQLSRSERHLLWTIAFHTMY